MKTKQKAISPLITATLLVVVAVIIVAIILSYGKDITLTSLNKADLQKMSESSVDSFIYFKSFKDGTLMFNYSPPSNLSESIIIKSYKIFSAGSESDEINLSSNYTLHQNLNILVLDGFSDLNITAYKINIQLYTTDGKYIIMRNILNSQPYISLDANTDVNVEEETPCVSGIDSDGNYIICYVEDFETLRSTPDGNYVLGRDIDFFNPDDWLTPPTNIATTTDNWNSGSGFVKINEIFTGVFDGNNKVIRNLYINRTDDGELGFFRETSGALISNLGLEDVNITGGQYVSALVVYNGTDSIISNSYSSGQITALNNYAGGLVVNNGAQATISNCYSAGYVNSWGGNIGGLVEKNESGATIEYSYSNSFVNGYFNDGGGDNVGGLIGENAGQLKNVYFSGEVNGNGNNIGGLIGYQNGGDIISQVYSTGDVILDYGTSVGGLVGFVQGEGIQFDDCYSTGNIISESGGDSIGGLIGKLSDGKVTNNYSDSDITVSGGNYVGGLIGSYEGSQLILHNYATGNLNVVLGNSVGGLIGRNVNGTVQECYATGSVLGEGQFYGGLIGHNQGIAGYNYATGDVNVSGDYVGGLIGSHESSENYIYHCYSAGEVSATGTVGGLIGASLLEPQQSYYDLNRSGQSDEDGRGRPKETSWMMTGNSFINQGWDFKDIWDINESTSYPYLINNTQNPLPQ